MGGRVKPRVLFVARTRYRLPLDVAPSRKFEALRRELDLRVLASAERGSKAHDAIFELVPPVRPRVLDGPLFYLALPLRTARRLRQFAPDVIVAQSPYEGAAVLAARVLARRRPRLIVEIHGDWRSSTRLYGSRVRSLLAPVADRVAALVVRRADAVRTLSPFTTGLVEREGVRPAATFTTFSDLEAFTVTPRAPLPVRPRALFVGVLERYKNVETLVAAWRMVARALPEAELQIVGRGREAARVEQLTADLPTQVLWTPRLTPAEVAEALDASTLLVLPSRSEGTPRIMIEALCRSRPVVAARVGGTADLLEEGEAGFLVEPDDVTALADALIRVLADRPFAEQLARGAGAAASRWIYTAAEYAERTRALVDDVLSQ
jgi:glycosyltransferase involved in cell wall biosynthesis